MLVRPSYVLGRSRDDDRVHSASELRDYVGIAVEAARDAGTQAILLVDEFLKDAIEVDVDCVSDGKRAVDRRRDAAHRRSRRSTPATRPACCHRTRCRPTCRHDDRRADARRSALELGVVGLMNVQFAVKGRDVYVLEVNPRARARCPSSPRPPAARSPRSPPKVMVGKTLDDLGIDDQAIRAHVAVKRIGLPVSTSSPVSTPSWAPRCARPAK